MIKNLPVNAKNYLLKIYNNCILNDEIPDAWRNHLLLNILKPNKDPNNSSSYRPIILSSCFLKTLELLIKNRLDWFIENKDILSKYQMGFRKGMNTTICTNTLISHIKNAFLNNQTTIVVLLDIKSAYDNVNISKLFNKLKNLKFPYKLNKAIFNSLKLRYIFARKNDATLIGPKRANSGLLQGSPLSSILFNVYIHDLFSYFDREVKVLAYADDLAIYVSGANPVGMVKELNRSLEFVQGWLDDNDLQLSLNKCESIFFNNSQRTYLLPQVKIENFIVPYKDKVKYLGIILDDKLKFTNHINLSIEKAKKNINILKKCSRTWWGIDPLSMLNVYKALILSHLDYGSTFYDSCNIGTLLKLDRVQFEALRACMGCMRSTPTNVLLNEASQLDLAHRRQIIISKMVAKVIKIRDHPLIVNLLIWRKNWIIRRGMHMGSGIPFILRSIAEFFPFYNRIYRKYSFPCYITEYNILITQIPIVDLPIKKSDPDIPKAFKACTNRYKNDFTFIFTDASKVRDRSGFGIYIPQLDFKFSSRIPEQLCICNAELIAIHEALIIAFSKKLKDIIIFSDSRSAISKIKSCNISNNLDFITSRIKNLVVKANNLDCRYKLAWLPGHSGIQGNEMADKLANVGNTLNVPKNVYIDSIDIFNNIKSNLITNFKIKQKNSFREKGCNYVNIQNFFPQNLGSGTLHSSIGVISPL
ncbi:hypothetical protein ABEB36_007994 [Hypothenemus hampei]|uniref:Uncharacterized protein n=1 Tax=Hypothenemus hampei TaxID=57062 RepID=A0ABD1ENA0_HYPHA